MTLCICNKHNLSNNFLVFSVNDKALATVAAAGIPFVRRSQGLLFNGQSVPDGYKMDSLQDTAELGRGVCGVSGRIYVRHDKNTAQQGRGQSGTNNPTNTVVGE